MNNDKQRLLLFFALAILLTTGTQAVSILPSEHLRVTQPPSPSVGGAPEASSTAVA